MSLGRMVCLDELEKCFIPMILRWDEVAKQDATNRVHALRGFENATVEIVVQPEERTVRAYVDATYMVTMTQQPATIESV